MSERQVRRILSFLEEERLLIVVERATGHMPTRYLLRLVGNPAPPRHRPPVSGHRRASRVDGAKYAVAPLSPQPPHTPSDHPCQTPIEDRVPRATGETSRLVTDDYRPTPIQMTAQSLWGAVVERLKANGVTQPNVDIYLAPCTGIACDGGQLLVRAPNAHIARQVNDLFGRLILRIAEEVAGRPLELQVVFDAADCVAPVPHGDGMEGHLRREEDGTDA